MAKPSEYVYIRVWGKMLRSSNYYIRDLQKEASLLDAPVNTIYRSTDGSWFTTDMLGKGNRGLFFSMCKELGVPLPDYEGEGE